MREPQPRIGTIRSAEALQALSHPTRIQILDAVREPESAAGVARRLGQPRQRIHYHLKALEEALLVEPVGKRQHGNFIETLYRSTARSFVISPEVTWSDTRRLETLKSQHSLETLVAFGERLQCDAAELLDRASFDDEEIPSAAVSAELHFAGEAERAAFMREYLETLKALIERYESNSGDAYRVVLAVHPRPEGSSQ